MAAVGSPSKRSRLPVKGAERGRRCGGPVESGRGWADEAHPPGGVARSAQEAAAAAAARFAPAKAVATDELLEASACKAHPVPQRGRKEGRGSIPDSPWLGWGLMALVGRWWDWGVEGG